MSQTVAADGISASTITPADFKLGMRRLASGVAVIAVEDQGQRLGLAATAVSSISADPATLMVCINHNASAHDAALRAGCFTVNLLGQSDREVADLFGSSANRAKRFGTREWKPLTTGAPALSGCLASFDCRTVKTLTVASHTIFFGEIVDLALSQNPIEPLLHWGGSYKILTKAPFDLKPATKVAPLSIAQDS